MSQLYSLHYFKVRLFHLIFYFFLNNQTGLLKDHMICSCLAGVNGLNSGPWVLVEDLSSVFHDVEVERGAVKHAHKKRKLADGREKTIVSPDNKLFMPEFCKEDNIGKCLFSLKNTPLFSSRAQMMKKAWEKVVVGTF